MTISTSESPILPLVANLSVLLLSDEISLSKKKLNQINPFLFALTHQVLKCIV